MKKKIEFIQLPRFFDPYKPIQSITIMQIEDGITVGFFRVMAPKSFPEFKLNPYLLN
jgi:hypothetical protein